MTVSISFLGIFYCRGVFYSEGMHTRELPAMNVRETYLINEIILNIYINPLYIEWTIY